MKKLTIILIVISFAFKTLNSQVPESQQVVESFIIKGLQSGITKVSIQYNQDMLREVINYEKPDSNGIYQLGSKYLYEYNESGKFTHIQTLVFKDGEWKIYEERILDYDGNGNLVRNITLNIFGNMVDLDTATVFESIYDNSGNLIEKTDKIKAYGSVVQNRTKTTSFYTETNKIKTQNTFKWLNNEWVNNGMIRKSFNEYDSLICDSTFKWTDNKWANSMLFNYGYDSERNLKSLEIFIYEDGQWTKMERYSYNYDENRRRVETIKTIGINNHWVDGGRGTIEFRSDGQMANEKGYSLINGEWEVVSITEYEYNDNDKNTEIKNKILLDDVWTYTYRYIFEYTTDNILLNLKYQIWKDDVWQNADKKLAFKDKYNEYNYDAYELNLQWIPVSVEELQSQSDINLYPNPASDFITIQLSIKGLQPFAPDEKVQIFDVLGIEVMSESIHPMTSSHRMNVEKLPAGVYFIRIGTRVEKFVKK